MSNISTYKAGGYSVTKIRFSNGDTMTVRKVKSNSSKRSKPGYNYKLISTAILRAKTPKGAAQAAMKARQKLGELLRGSNEGSDPDLRAAVIHVRKMELIAKRKKKHLEQEEMAEREQSAPDDNEEKAEDALLRAGDISKEDEARLAKEIEEMEREVTKELRRKHRGDELRDITKADMEFLRAKFYRLQQEKAAAGIKRISTAGSSGSSVSVSDMPVDISIDASMDMDYPAVDAGAAIDMSV